MLFNGNLIPIPFNIRLGAALGIGGGLTPSTPEGALALTNNVKTWSALMDSSHSVEQVVGLSFALKL